MKKLPQGMLILFIGLLMAACNGGGDGGFTSGGTQGGSGGTAAPGGAAGSPSVEFGSGSGSDFQAGTLAIATKSLSAGGTTSVSATLMNSDGTPFTGDGSVAFISDCVQQGLATLDSPVALKNGAAVSTYTDKGCGTTDHITATVTVNGTRLTAQGTVVVAAAELGSVAFVSAEPASISFKGSGLTEASRVTFEVRDSSGNPLRDKTVNFKLSTDVGGITLSQDSATSGADGQVATVVHAGTIPTPVRVTATVADTSISTQSSILTISTGIADADSFSIAVETLNVESYNIDGVTDAVTVHLADRFNNPVPDGTAVSFHTDGGSITPQCTTTAGACSATWTSQNPRPADGRVKILAFVIGEETFNDTNGNGVFDDADTFTDVGEAYEDDNQNSIHDAGEFFYDFNKDGVWNGPDGHYEGLQCTNNCGPDGAVSGNFTTGIGTTATLVMSTSGAKICASQGGGTMCGTSAMTVGAAPFTLLVSDLNDQAMPIGTTIKLTGDNISINSATSSFTVGNTTAPGAYAIQMGAKGDTTKPASITVIVTSPKSVITTAFITVP